MSTIRSSQSSAALIQKQLNNIGSKSWLLSSQIAAADPRLTSCYIYKRTATGNVTSKKKRYILNVFKDQFRSLKNNNPLGNVSVIREMDIQQVAKTYYDKLVVPWVDMLKSNEVSQSKALQKKQQQQLQLQSSPPPPPPPLLPSKETKVAAKTKNLSTFEQLMQDTHESVASFYDSNIVKKPISGTEIQDKPSHLKKEEVGFSKMVSWMYTKKESVETKGRIIEKKPVIRKDFVSRTSVENRARALVSNLKLARSDSSKLSRMADICKHIILYPASRSVIVKAGAIPRLLRLSLSENQTVRSQAFEALSLVGYVAPPKGRGIRVLCIDGGGTRGLVALETLRKLQEACKMDLWKVFDYVCGVSTGALMLGLVILYRMPPDKCCELYKDLSQDMFTRNRFVGTGHLVWSHAFYDTKTWEDILRNYAGDSIMSKFSQDPTCPKMSALSCVMNMAKMKNFVFRTYNLPSGVYSQYPGNCKYKLWEAIRASSAAPGYYTEFQLDDLTHQDGGLLCNNPTALAIHECRLLWPNTPLQCVVSIGNGRYEPNLEMNTGKSTLKEKVVKILDSATDTEAVNTILSDLLPPTTYFRFNPYVSEEWTLDEIRSEKLKQMQHDTLMYLRRNDFKVQRCAEKLMQQRHMHQKMYDWVKLRLDMIER